MTELIPLIRKAQAGDTRAFDALSGKLRLLGCRIARHYVPDHHTAEDAVQDAFVDIYRRLPRLRNLSNFLGWFKVVVRGHSLKQTRGKRGAALPLELAPEIAAPGPTPEGVLVKAELRRRVRAALRDLPSPVRAAVQLHYFEGCSCSETGERLGVTRTCAKQRLSVGRRRLQEALQ